MSLIGGISKVLGGVGTALGGLGQIFKSLGGFLNSPIGSLLKMAFPPLGVAGGAMSLFGMVGDLAGGIGGGQDY